MMNGLKLYPCVLMCVIICVIISLPGCSTAGAKPVYGTGYLATKPDVVLVRPFAITPEEARLDRDIVPTWVLTNMRTRFQTEGDKHFGAIAAKSVADELVNQLTIRGIPAQLLERDVTPPSNATVITGQFVDLSTAVRSLRPEVGFSIKAGYQARVQVIQNSSMSFELDAYAKSSEGPTASRELAEQVAHQIYQSYVLGGWVSHSPIK